MKNTEPLLAHSSGELWNVEGRCERWQHQSEKHPNGGLMPDFYCVLKSRFFIYRRKLDHNAIGGSLLSCVPKVCSKE